MESQKRRVAQYLTSAIQLVGDKAGIRTLIMEDLAQSSYTTSLTTLSYDYEKLTVVVGYCKIFHFSGPNFIIKV